MADANVSIDAGANKYTLATEAIGRFAWWLHARGKPLQVTAAVDGWTSQVATVQLRADHATAQDFTLSRLNCDHA